MYLVVTRKTFLLRRIYSSRLNIVCYFFHRFIFWGYIHKYDAFLRAGAFALVAVHSATRLSSICIAWTVFVLDKTAEEVAFCL